MKEMIALLYKELWGDLTRVGFMVTDAGLNDLIMAVHVFKDDGSNRPSCYVTIKEDGGVGILGTGADSADLPKRIDPSSSFTIADPSWKVEVIDAIVKFFMTEIKGMLLKIDNTRAKLEHIEEKLRDANLNS